MKVLTIPIISERVMSEYTFGDNEILEKVYSLKEIEEGDEKKTEKEFKEYRLYDLSNIEEDKLYNSYDSIKDVRMVDGEVHFTLLDYVSNISEDEEISEEYLDAEIVDIEYPEDAEVLTFEAVIFSEPEENSPIKKLEDDNKALTLRVEELKKQMESDKKANEKMTLELLELMMGLI